MNAVKSIVVGLLCLSAGVAVAVGGAWNGPDAYLELLICDKVGSVGPVAFTSVVPTPQTEVEAVYTVRNAADAQCLLCSRDNTNNNQYSRYFVFYANIGGSSKVNGTARLDYNTKRTATATITNVVDAACRAAISGAKVSLSVDAEESEEFGYDVSSFTPSTPLRLFASGNGATGASGEYFSGTLSSLRVWDYDGAAFENRKLLKADFRPAVVNAVTGLWDRVTCTFLPSSTDVAFAGEGVIERYVEVASNDESFAPADGYGVFAVDGDAMTFTAPVGGMSADGRVKAVCRGWKLYKRGAATPFRTSTDAGESANSCTVEYTEPVKLVWDLKVEYKVTATAGAGGTVSPAEQWVEKYRTATVVATPATGKGLWAWTGGRRTERAETFAEVCIGPMELTAEFEDATTVTDATLLLETFTALDEEIAAGTKTRGILKLPAGEYPIREKIVMTHPIHIVGAGSAVTAVKPSKSGYGAFNLNNEEAYLYGLKITGVREGPKGAGVRIAANGGILEACHVCDNECTEWDPRGAGIYIESANAIVTRCVIEDNNGNRQTGSDGPGVYMDKGLLEDSLIIGNYASAGSGSGGGVCASGPSIVRNCTIVKNTTRKNGGGVCVSADTVRLINCAIYDNTAANDASEGSPNWYGCAEKSYVSCASTVAPNGSCLGCVGDFNDADNRDYSLLVSSALRDAADVGACVAGLDILGNDRCSAGGAPDIGCYEFDATKLSVGFSVAPEAVFVGGEVTFAPIVLGASDTATRTWTMTDEHGAETVLPATCEKGIVLTEPGLYSVTLTVTDGDKAPSSVKTGCLYVSPKTNYVDSASSDPVSPYATPETAAMSPLDVMPYANRINGSVVLVKDGTYELDKQVELTAAVELVSEHGQEVTEFKRKGANCRLVYMNNSDASATGFTLSGGYVGGYGGGCYIGPKGGSLLWSTVQGCSSTGHDCPGGGIYASAAATVSRCRVLRNSGTGAGNSCGGGIHMADGGRVDNCLVIGNVSRISGSGIFASGDCTVVNCTFVANTNNSGNAALYLAGNAKAYNCASFDNTATKDASVGGPDWYGPSDSFVNCAFPAKSTYETAMPNDTCRNVEDPGFSNRASFDLTLKNSSPLRDAGTSTGVDVGETDLNGDPRCSLDTAPDIGCYEFDANQLAVGFIVTPQAAFSGSTFVFTPTIDGATGGYAKEWTIVDEHGVTNVLDAACENGVVLDAPGLYDVTLKVTLGDTVVSEVKPGYLYVGPQTLYVNLASAAARSPYGSPGAAATNLLDAVSYANRIPGTTVVVEDGDYVLANQVALEASVTLRSVHGAEKTRLVAAPGTSHRVVSINDPDALIVGFALTGGNEKSGKGGGCYIGPKGGTIADCVITNNVDDSYDSRGGGVFTSSQKAFVRRCVILNNRAARNGTYCNGGGAAIEIGTIENCLVAHNTAWDKAGGVYAAGSGSKVVNCTICDNTASDEECGGLYLADGAKAWNCAVFGNVANNDATAGSPDWVGGSSEFVNCAVPVKNTYDGLMPNDTCLNLADPGFADQDNADYTLSSGSALIDGGTSVGVEVGEADLLGAPRRSRDSEPDIGCYEYDKNRLGVGFSIEPSKAFVGGTFVLTPKVEGATEEYAKTWTLTDREGQETELEATCETTGFVVDEPGTYDVRLVVSMGGKDYQFRRQACLQVAVRTNFVNVASVTAAWPYATPATAASNLTEAIAETIPGSTVVVSAGDYYQTAQVKVEKAISLVAEDGPEATVIRRDKGGSVLVVNDAGATVRGFTLTDGRCDANGQRGAGLWIGANGGLVENCIITNNSASNNGQEYGCGVYLSGDKAVLRGSLIARNFECANRIVTQGTGVYMTKGTLESCVVCDNRGRSAAVVALGSALVRNCTIVANTNANGTAGVNVSDSAMVKNCIIRDNVYTGADTLEYGPDWYDGSETRITYCCTPVVPYKSTSTVTEDPGYAGNGDYDLPRTSPCCQKGENWEGCATATDFLGRPRKVRRFIDIGAFENQSKPGLSLLLR